MSDDRLDVIHAYWMGDAPAYMHADHRIVSDVLALVEIARTARTLVGQPFGQLSERDFYKLRESVGRLTDAD